MTSLSDRAAALENGGGENHVIDPSDRPVLTSRLGLVCEGMLGCNELRLKFRNPALARTGFSFTGFDLCAPICSVCMFVCMASTAQGLAVYQGRPKRRVRSGSKEAKIHPPHGLASAATFLHTQ